MKKILLSHFYNEEYLLPFWLKHHKNIFDEGIMIDYNSTDNSSNIIKEICPHWKIYKSQNESFSAQEVDKEITYYENNIEDGDYRICLNTTEFLICNNTLFIEKLNNQYFIPSFIMIDTKEQKYSELNSIDNMIIQRSNGIHFDQFFSYRRARSLHNFNIKEYPLGRHFERYNTLNAVICWYGFSPFNKNLIKRKLQIQNKIPYSDKCRGLGNQHITNEQDLEKKYEELLKNSYNLKDEINKILGNNSENE